MDELELRKCDISIKGNQNVKTWVIDYNNLQSVPIHKHKYILYLVRANRTMLLTLIYYGQEIQKTHYIDCKFTKTKAYSKQFLVNLRELIEIKNAIHNVFISNKEAVDQATNFTLKWLSEN